MVQYISFTFFVVVLIAVYAFPVEGECDKSKCKGPLRFYEDVSCKPVYKNEGDCCPYKYNCDHLKGRSTDKCYANGHEYNLEETLRKEDAKPCDIGCFCNKNAGVAEFTCAIVDCFTRHLPDCYNPRKATQCCPGAPVCPKKPEDWPTCEVDGKIYKAAEYFSPAGEPKKDCYCDAGYKGENVEPFCRVRINSECGIELRHSDELHNNYPPVYYSAQSPQTDCPVAYRYQNSQDKVIKPEGTTASSGGSEDDSGSEDMMCKFGTLKIRLGEELNQKTNYDSVCVKCVCEVPPVLTCQRLPDDICDVTDHPDFTNVH
ncbi:uncharacterized protein LOC107037211 [Diachasma alloeum]|uniref:uncharacterized protein LOC107037211 n=1 Tax=Diachasma alloeum TaxID=454923 RepID=UPI0007383DD6|nr:uncharacterized protein LOC107037211 [Diachasma alloeum]